jgi:hypothetical protein
LADALEDNVFPYPSGLASRRFTRVARFWSASRRFQTFADTLVRIEELFDFWDERGVALARIAQELRPLVWPFGQSGLQNLSRPRTPLGILGQ